jgi:hypothetical protein
MDTSVRRVICVLLLVGGLVACGSRPSSPSDQTVANTEIIPTMSLFGPPPATVASVESVPPPQENPGASPTPLLSSIPTDTIQLKPALCNDSRFVEDVTIPDMSVLGPGEGFKKTWKMLNTGSCQWTTSYAIAFAYGESMRGKETKLPSDVPPGGMVDVSVYLTAPMVNGWYGGFWRLKSDTGINFGDFVYVSIVVSDGSETNTPSS